MYFFFFFFQAEDGIRDFHVTGVQTCALPISQNATVRTMIDNKELQERLAKLKPVAQEVFRVDIGEGVELDGWMLKPPDFDPKKRYPVLFHVYGEPCGQTVLGAWGGRNQMWHMM